MKINYSQKRFILFTSIFIVVLVLNIIFINLLLNKIISINNKVRQLDISSQNRLKELTLKDFIINSGPERKKLDEYFIGSGNAQLVEFTKYLEDLAETIGVTQEKSLAYETIEGLPLAKTVTSVRYRFNITGPWAKVYTFLWAVENLPKVAILNNVTLNVIADYDQARGTASTQGWSAEIDFSVAKLIAE